MIKKIFYFFSTLIVLNHYFYLFVNLTSCLLSAFSPLIELQSLSCGVVDEEERSRTVMVLRESDCG